MADMTIGIPSFGTVSIHFAMSLTAVAMPLNFSNQYNVLLGKPIDVARNEIVDSVLADPTEPRYLAFIDDDVIMPPDALRKLIYRLEHSPESVGVFSGVYFSRSDPCEPLIFKKRARGPYWNWRLGDIFPAWAAGCGLCVIRTEALRRIVAQQGKPLFKVDFGLAELAPGKFEARSLTEDLYFYTKLGKTVSPDDENYRLMIDTSIQASHFDKDSNSFFSLPQESPQAQGHAPLRSNGVYSMLWVGYGGKREEHLGMDITTTDALERFSPDATCPPNVLPYDEGSFDRLYASYVLHSMTSEELVPTLVEWRRVLKDGGKCWVRIPNIDCASSVPPETALQLLYRGKSGLNRAIAEKLFTEAGFSDLLIWTAGEKREELNVMGVRG